MYVGTLTIFLWTIMGVARTLSARVAKVTSLRFLWSLGWVHSDELKGIFGEYTKCLSIWVLTCNCAHCCCIQLHSVVALMLLSVEAPICDHHADR